MALSERLPGTLPSDIETKPKEYCKAITIRNGVQLPKITIKRPIATQKNIPTTIEEHLEESEQNKQQEKTSKD